MAIVIKAKNIYGNISNDKILDNVIDSTNYYEIIVNTSYTELGKDSSLINTSNYKVDTSGTTYGKESGWIPSFEFLRKYRSRLDYDIKQFTRTYTIEKTDFTNLIIKLSGIWHTATKNEITVNTSTEESFEMILGEYDPSSWSLPLGLTFSSNDMSEHVNKIIHKVYYTYELSNNNTNLKVTYQIISKAVPYKEYYSTQTNEWIITNDYSKDYYNFYVDSIRCTTTEELANTSTNTFNYKEGINTFKLEENGLMSNSSYYYVKNIGNKSIGSILSQRIIDSYNKGKEVIKIQTDITNYYDTDNNLVVAPEVENYKKLITLDDEVIPYKIVGNQEVPISVNADGTAKSFIVISTERAYDGVLWNNLILLEKN